MNEIFIPILCLLLSLIYLGQVWQEVYIVVLWPYIIIALLWGCNLILLMRIFKFKRKPRVESKKILVNTTNWLSSNRKPLYITWLTILYLGLIPYLGFSLSNFFYLITLFWLLGTHQFLSTISLSGIITAILHLIIIEFLQMSVPRLSLPWTNWSI